MTIYTIGYARWNQRQLLQQVQELDGLLIDVRLRPFSRKPGFTQKQLEEGVEQRGISYHHLPGFGNVNYRGGPIELRAPSDAMKTLDALLSDGKPPILLCGCSDHRRCHRTAVARFIARRNTPTQIEHLYPEHHTPTGELFPHM